MNEKGQVIRKKITTSEWTGEERRRMLVNKYRIKKISLISTGYGETPTAEAN